MLYGIPLICLLTALYFRKKGVTRFHKALWIVFIYLSMFLQSAALLLDGQWSVRTGLPLHVCGFSGVMSLPALTRDSPALSRFFRRVSLPGALLALIFPAVLPTKYMILSEISFFLLHSLLLSLPLLLPPSQKRGATGMYRICLSLLVTAIAVNEIFRANYLFLRALPSGTPFSLLNAYPAGLRALFAPVIAVFLSYAEGFRRKNVPDG